MKVNANSALRTYGLNNSYPIISTQIDRSNIDTVFNRLLRILNDADIKTAMFDMDGTLVDTERLRLETVKDLCNRHGIRMDANDEELFLGAVVEEFLHDLLDKRKSELDLDDLMADYRQNYHAKLEDELQSFTGVVEILKCFQRNGFKVALVSGSPREDVDFILEKLKLKAFITHDNIVSCDIVEKTKPDPESYQTAAKNFGINCAKSVVFEDSPRGIKAAKAAGMKVIAVKNSREQDFSELSSSDIDCLLDLTV